MSEEVGEDREFEGRRENATTQEFEKTPTVLEGGTDRYSSQFENNYFAEM